MHHPSILAGASFLLFAVACGLSSSISLPTASEPQIHQSSPDPSEDIKRLAKTEGFSDVQCTQGDGTTYCAGESDSAYTEIFVWHHEEESHAKRLADDESLHHHALRDGKVVLSVNVWNPASARDMLSKLTFDETSPHMADEVEAQLTAVPGVHSCIQDEAERRVGVTCDLSRGEDRGELQVYILPSDEIAHDGIDERYFVASIGELQQVIYISDKAKAQALIEVLRPILLQYQDEEPKK